MCTNNGYGFSVDNPIELTMVDAEYVYLNSLTFIDGSTVYYKRVGSMLGPKPNPIDRFKIYRSQADMEADKEPDAELYLYGYAEANTTEAPEGFSLHIERPDLWMMPPVWL